MLIKHYLNQGCKKVKKIGIITHYYKSNNYGGLLQAFALCKLLTKYGYSAEQICYDTTSSPYYTQGISDSKIYAVKGIIKNKLSSIYHKFVDRNIHKKIYLRNSAIAKFAQRIPHSTTIYTDSTIKESNGTYDVFITGSDQVWNLDWYFPAYFLDFVEKDKPKISYAASISKDTLSEVQKEIIKNHLLDYKAISVRELSSVELISDFANVDVKWVLDPTLLLTAEEWESICSERDITEKYIFCYFLGEDSQARHLAEEYARKHSLKVVTIPYLSGHYRKCDGDFGDIQLFDVDPGKFITLIKDAEVVFTDSFHATVFSNIFKKQYYTFERSGFTSMSSRIFSLIKLFQSETHFCNSDEKKTFSYIESIAPIDYSMEQVLYNEMKDLSLKFLLENI